VNLSFSPPVKIIAAFGAVLVVVAGGGMMLLGGGGSGSATHESVRQTHAAVSKTTTAHKTTTANGTTKTSATKATTAKTAHGTTTVHKHATVTTSPTGKKTATKTVTVTHTHKHVVHHHRARPSGNLVSADLPAPLQWQLARHHIVVVSLYDPQSDVDSISVAEAHAGATEAGAGFLLVNVLDNSIAGPLTALLPGGGLLPDPGILIYRSPGNLAYRIDGFSDRDAVAQAVANAFAGQNGTTVTASASTVATG
jgi:hypothetical protein